MYIVYIYVKKCVTCFLREVCLPSGTELTPVFPCLRAGLLKRGSYVDITLGNRLLVTDHGLSGFPDLMSTQAWVYRSPNEVSLDRRLKFTIICEFIQVPSDLSASQGVVIQQLSIG